MSMLLFWSTDITMTADGLAFFRKPSTSGGARSCKVNHYAWFTIPAMTIYEIALLVLTPLLVWRIYARLKTAMAPQRSVVSRHWLGLGVFGAMALIVLAEASRDMVQLGYGLVGLAFGIGWGVFGARRTRMEEREDGYWFRPYARLGIVIAMLFFARMLYVGFDLYVGGQPMQRLTASPLTVLAMTVMAGYFGTLSASLLRWRLSRG